MIKQYTASGIIFYNNTVLLLKHKKMNTWIYPGGHIEEGEFPEECLVREILEETGYKAKIVNINQFNYCDCRAKTLHQPFCILEENVLDGCAHKHIDFVYICEVNDTNVYTQPEYENKKWFTKEEITNLDIMENFRFILFEAFKAFNNIYYYHPSDIEETTRRLDK